MIDEHTFLSGGAGLGSMIGVFYYLRVMLVMVRRTEPEQETAVLPKWQTPNGCVLIILAVLLFNSVTYLWMRTN